jgi:hypothetical protein
MIFTARASQVKQDDIISVGRPMARQSDKVFFFEFYPRLNQQISHFVFG